MRKFVISCCAVALVLVLWLAAVSWWHVPSVLIPSPRAVWDTFVELCQRGYGLNRDTLGVHFLSSMGRLLAALAAAVATGVPLGLLSGSFEAVRAAVGPFVEFYRPLPPLAYYTLLVLWMGIGEGSKVMLLYLAAFAPIYIACVSGVERVRKEVVNSAYMLGANRWQCFFYVILPASLPDIFTGVRTAVGVAYSTLVSAEMVAATRGLGWMVLDAANWLKSDVVFLCVILMGATGILLNQALLWLENSVIHWKGK